MPLVQKTHGGDEGDPKPLRPEAARGGAHRLGTAENAHEPGRSSVVAVSRRRILAEADLAGEPLNR